MREEILPEEAKVDHDAIKLPAAVLKPLQKQARGYAVPDSFTHGTSAQRQRWFNAGFQSGNINSCDTFGAQSL